MYLFFDVSAAGRPKSWKAPVEDTFNWPRMTHIAWEVVDEDSEIIESTDYLIKPEGFEISPDSAEFHGVSEEDAKTQGKDLEEVLKEFAKKIDEAEYIFSFNFKYNSSVVGAEFIRKKIPHRLFTSEYYCLMQESTFYTKITGRDGRYKWPSLSELFQKIFGHKYEGANQADKDVRATSMCFFYMLNNNILELD